MPKIMVYLDDSRVYEYDCPPHKAREHMNAISSGGYFHNDGVDKPEMYGPHRIKKVAYSEPLDTMYPDTLRGT